MNCDTAPGLRLLCVAALSLSGIGGLNAQSSLNYTVVRWVADQGGGYAESDGYRIMDVVGQSSALGQGAGGGYFDSGGFMPYSGAPSGVPVEDNVEPLPSRFELFQNYPNPFNPATTINYHLPDASEVELVIYALTGKEVRRLFEGARPAGRYVVRWDGRDGSGGVLPSGVYFCRIVAKSRTGSRGPVFRDFKKMILMK